MSDGYRFNFPATRFVVGENELTRRGQADQITQEAAEVFSAAESGDDVAYIAEVLDCIHACETALREFDVMKINKLRVEVLRKNAGRGYYLGVRNGCKQVSDQVNHPSHYPDGSADLIERIIDGLPAKPAALLFNVLKYAIRAGKKDDADQDIGKANNYAHRLVFGKWRWEHENEDSSCAN